MSNESDDDQAPKIKRRDFLSSAALPVAAALTPNALFAQQRQASTSARDKIRVGIIGAGGIVGSVHIPGLRKMPGVEIVAVANRSLESSRRAADEFGIPRAYADWEQLLGDKKIDAAIAVLRLNMELHSASANAWDSLAEATEASGDTAAAIALYRRALALASRKEAASQQDAPVRAHATQRLKALGVSP